jgi:hypothetical protein
MDWLPPLALSERLRQVQGEGWGGVAQGVKQKFHKSMGSLDWLL